MVPTFKFIRIHFNLGDTLKILIPCAGLGSRKNMPINKSKELLLDAKGKPIIEWCLQFFPKEDYHLIIRREKEDLIEYAERNNLNYQIITKSREMPDTILKARKYWSDTNLLVLPDTRFGPESNLGLVEHGLGSSDIVLGIHNVPSLKTWGAVQDNRICEKPDLDIPGTAWGFIGFNKEIGVELFTNMLVKNQWFEYNNIVKIPLDHFEDITRK